MTRGFLFTTICILLCVFALSAVPTYATEGNEINTGSSQSNVTIQNQGNTNVLNISCQCTPTPQVTTPISVVVPTSTTAAQAVATATPGSSEVTATPTPSSSAATAVATPTPVASVNSTSEVLGASSMAPTGTFFDNLMDFLAIIGLGFISVAGVHEFKKTEISFISNSNTDK